MLIPELYSFFGFAWIIGLGIFSNYLLHRLDLNVLTEEDAIKNPNLFIANRVWFDLKVLNDLGPKVVGSNANEVGAVNYILKQVNEIAKSNPSVGKITVDHQIVSGVNFGTSIYRNLQNVVVRVQGTSDYAVMLNCHFDSVAGSPGASDDIANCCVMLEILRVISNGYSHEHTIIFLFNGSEEEDLQAAHGFITQHKWAKDVKAYINLESTGSGGREILFRTGPKHDWLVKKYRESVKRPFGQEIAEELFETGIIPSATDFQIFRDNGQIPGLDFAHIENGWRYHTNYDSIDYLSKEMLQHTGENILGLTKSLANSEELPNPPEGTHAVYFDFLGLFFVSYTKQTGVIINVIVSIFAVLITFLFQIKFRLVNCKRELMETILSFVTIVLSSVLSLAVCYGMAAIMNALDKTMSFFNVTFLSIGIYCSLAVIVQIGSQHICSQLCDYIYQKTREDKEVNRSPRDILRAFLNGINLFWAIATIIITSTGFRFGYITMVMLLITLCTNVVIFIFCDSGWLATRTHNWMFIHILGQSVNVLWTSYIMMAAWELFIPITGKTFYENPDTTVALICCMATIFVFSYLIPLTHVVKYRAVLYAMVLTTFLISFILAMTSAGFPYSANPSDPRVQRHRVVHTKRTFHDATGGVEYSDSGFLISEFDRNARRTIESVIDSKELIFRNDDSFCKSEVFCGFPSFGSLYRSSGRWLKGNGSLNMEESVLSLVDTNSIGINTTELTFELYGRTLTMLYISPQTNVNLLSWTLTDKSPVLNSLSADLPAYTAKITYGKYSADPFTFKLTLLNNGSLNNVKITVVTIDSTFDKSPMTPEFSDLVTRFPDYTFVYSQQATVSSFIF